MSDDEREEEEDKPGESALFSLSLSDSPVRITNVLLCRFYFVLRGAFEIRGTRTVIIRRLLGSHLDFLEGCLVCGPEPSPNNTSSGSGPFHRPRMYPSNTALVMIPQRRAYHARVGRGSPVVLGWRWIGIVARFAPLLLPVMMVSLPCCGGLSYGFSILGVDGRPSLPSCFAKEALPVVVTSGAPAAVAGYACVSTTLCSPVPRASRPSSFAIRAEKRKKRGENVGHGGLVVHRSRLGFHLCLRLSFVLPSLPLLSSASGYSLYSCHS